MTTRRDFLRTTAAVGLAATAPLGSAAAAAPTPTATDRAPDLLVRRAVKPVVIADYSGYAYKNGGPENAVERAFRGITAGEDVPAAGTMRRGLDTLVHMTLGWVLR